MLKPLFALPRTVWLLGLVSFFNDAASELVYPLVPIYLASVLMAGPKALGLIERIAEATGNLLSKPVRCFRIFRCLCFVRRVVAEH
jgi:hypothetical protein